MLDVSQKLPALENLIPNEITLGKALRSSASAENPSILGGFSQLIQDKLADLSKLEAHSNQLNQDYAMGKDVPIHQVMIAMEKASTAMELTVQVRNKILQAYQEFNRMSV
jgi:flagellar hook-basal body complex protein FliE